MKFFESLKNYFAIFGLNSYQSIQSHSFNDRNKTALLFFIISSTVSFVFLFHSASSFKDYTDAVNMTAIKILGTLVMAISIWKLMESFKFAETFESIVKKSEYTVISKISIEYS